MLAGGVSFAVPGVMPEAYAEDQYLYVSAESAGEFAGAQIVEIVVNNPNMSELNTDYGMPDVAVNGVDLIMAQAVDGSWYAYITDVVKSQKLDAKYAQYSDGTGSGADFGKICGPGTDLAYKGSDEKVDNLIATGTQGVWLPYQLRQAGDTDAGHGVDGSSSFSTSTAVTDCTLGDDDFTLFLAIATTGSTIGVNGTANAQQNVVREAPTLSNQTTSSEYGNIRLGANLWPLIQTLDMPSKGDVEIVYSRGGVNETVTLTFDDGADGLTFDKEVYGLNHEVGVTLTDWNLNLDPTDEDVWTFATLPSNSSMFYQLFDENGAEDANKHDTEGEERGAVLFDVNSVGTLAQAGLMTIDRNGPTEESDATTDAVLSFQANADVSNTSTSSGLVGLRYVNGADQPVTFTETGANTGVFTNWDEALKTNMIIAETANRNTQAVFTYDDESYGVLHQPQFASISYQTEDIGDEWNSGEVVEIHIEDADMNIDPRKKDQMKSTSATTVVPAIKIGSPITLATVNTIDYPNSGTEQDSGIADTQCSSNYASSGAGSYESCYEKYSERIIFTPGTTDVLAADESFMFNWSTTTVGDLEDLLSSANGSASFVYVQYDFRSLNGGDDNTNITGNFTFGDTTLDATSGTTPIGESLYWSSDSGETATSCIKDSCGQFTGLVGNVLIQDVDNKLHGMSSLTKSDVLVANMAIKAVDSANDVDITSGTNYPISLDIVSWGQSNDGKNASDRHNNAIYRVEAKETGFNTDVFKAEIEYVMLNQLNVNDTATYNNTVAYGKELVMVVHNDLTDEDEVRVSYLDYGFDGVETQVSDQLAAPTHSGVVEFDSDSYKEADTVTITLTDSDLNTDTSLVDIYTVVNSTQDVAHDTVGTANRGANTLGTPFGQLLEVTIDDERWLDEESNKGSTSGEVCTSGTIGSSVVDGLYNSGFSLIETGIDSGVFEGTFQIPSDYAARNSGTCTATKTLGKDLEVNYIDYRDASGEIIEVGDSAGIRANTGSVS